MNKTQLVDAVSADAGFSKDVVARIINSTLNQVQATVAAGDTVQIIGFGSFERRFREGGERRNPQGGTVTVPDRHVPAFKAGSTFKATVGAV